MADQLSFLCPPNQTGGSIQCRSGNVYTPNNSGIITNVLAPDILDLLLAGCVPNNGLNPQPSWVSGRFYGVPPNSPAVFGINQLTVLGSLYAYPIYVPNQVNLQAILLGIATGQTGGKGRAGVYADNDAGYPGALMADSGDLAATATANPSGALSPAVQLSPGLYWLASQFTASSTMPTAIGVAAPQNVGNDTAAHLFGKTAALNTYGIVATGQTYGAMPANFPAGAVPTVNIQVPIVGLSV